MNNRCIERHSGLYAIQPDYATLQHTLFLEGRLPEYPVAESYDVSRLAIDIPPDSVDDLISNSISYQVLDGLAIFGIAGPIYKGLSKFGGSSSVGTRKALQAMQADTEVEHILLVVDSPGGMVSGTDQLASDIANSKKPVWVAADDQMASAAYWLATGAKRISANRAAEVGSLGVYAVIRDESKKLEKQGIKLHVVATGEQKGKLVAGSEIDEVALAEVRKSVEFSGQMFSQAIANGRKLSPEDVAKVFTGQSWPAHEALQLGLIDAVEPLETTINLALSAIKAARAKDNKKRSYRF